MEISISYFSQILQHKLFKNSFIYTFLTVLKSAVPLLLLPILTRYLSPSDYGVIAMFEILLTVFIIFVSLNAQSAASIVFFKLDREQLKAYLGNSVFLVLFSFGITLLFAFILKDYIFQWTQFPQKWLPFIILIALLNFPIMLLLILWQMNEKPWPFGLFNLLIILSNILFSIYFVVGLDWHWEGRMWGVALSTLILAIASCVILYRQDYFRFSFNQKYMRDILSYGLPLIPHMLGGWILVSVDRMMLNSMVGLETGGLYTVGYQISAIIGLLMQSFNQAWSPFLFNKLKQNDETAKSKIVKLTYVVLFGCLMFALLLSLTAPYLLNIFVGKDFYSANQYIPWLSIASAANGMYYMVVGYIFYSQKTYWLITITCLSALMNVVLNYVMIRLYGGVGAAQATALTAFFNLIMVWIVSAKVYPMPWLRFQLKAK